MSFRESVSRGRAEGKRNVVGKEDYWVSRVLGFSFLFFEFFTRNCFLLLLPPNTLSIRAIRVDFVVLLFSYGVNRRCR